MNDYTLPFGRYQGESLQSVLDRDPQYLIDMAEVLEKNSGPTYRVIVDFLFQKGVSRE